MIVPGVNCLVYHKEHAWVPGVVEDFDGKLGVVNVTAPKKETITKVKEEEIFVCDDKAAEESVDDLLNLSVLHDSTLLMCLRNRYFRDIVYTNIGAIVVAINPFNYNIPYYMDAKMPAYLAEGDTIQNNLPHSWAVAHNTFYEMRNDGGNQCILVSGESGAGKTEAAKIVMKYLGAVSSLKGLDEEKVAGQKMCLRMMQSNPILEAFGNAKTVRNDNSSRFGKLMRIKFNASGILTGADITKYLLEKSRIVTAALDERCYHSFYLLLKGSGAKELGLAPISEYPSVNAGKCVNIDGMDDADEYRVVNEALEICEVTSEQRTAVWRTVAGVLAMQRVEFAEIDADSCDFVPATERHLGEAAAFWGVDRDQLRVEMLTTVLIVLKQAATRTLNKIKALDGRDSLCKTLYDNLFSWLVAAINKTMDSKDCDSWIALLDIFGFEDFKQNSFEQMCINLTNETLQGHYNQYIFTRDMDECRAEGIDVKEIAFPDNKPCLEMISGKGGIISILDEECLLGKATDLTFLDKICDKFAKGHPFFERPKLAKVPSFRIVHYAGTVTYEVSGFLDKNRDTLKDAFKLLLNASSDPLIASLLPPPSEGVRYTVGGHFRNQLKDMMDVINSTNPHWIRCIKPHFIKKPLHFDGVMTLTQLRSSGVLGTVEIRKAGYPVRIKLADFARKYKVLACGVEGVDLSSPLDTVQAIYKTAGFGSKMAQVGKTRAFLKSEAYQMLEVMKKQRLQVFANTIVMAAQTNVAKHRTAAFNRNRQVETVQAFLTSRASQQLYRQRDYDAHKDVIIAHIRDLLNLQRREEAQRAALEADWAEASEEIVDARRAAVAALEAKWWAAKPARDEADLQRIEREELAARDAMLLAYQEFLEGMATSFDDEMQFALDAQEEREEEERQAELERIREEEERLREEEEARLEAERLEAIAKNDHLRRLSIYYWNKAAKETSEAKRRAEAEAAEKRRLQSQLMASSQLNEQLLRNERLLQARAREQYPQPRFRFDSKGAHVLDVGSPAMASPTATRHDPNSSAYLNDSAAMSPARARGSIPQPRRPTHGIGGLNPQFVVPAEERVRSLRARLTPDMGGSLQMVQQMRRLQGIRDPVVIRTPKIKNDDVRNPMNPSSPDWVPPVNETLMLPDGKSIKISVDMEIPCDDPRRARGRATTIKRDFFMGTASGAASPAAHHLQQQHHAAAEHEDPMLL